MVGTRFLLPVALLAVVDVVIAQRSCDDYLLSVENQEDIDFYKKCPLNETLFSVSHDFKGPFEMPEVESILRISSGYLGPKFKGSERVDDGITSFSMPDVKNVTGGGVLFGYLNNLTSIELPKLETVTGDIVILDSYPITELSLPALTTVDGGIWIEGNYDKIELPALKSVNFLKIVTTGDHVDCLALGKEFSDLTFTPKDIDPYEGFTCWTMIQGNNWDSTDEGAESGSDDKKPSAANTVGASSLAILLMVSIGFFLL